MSYSVSQCSRIIEDLRTRHANRDLRARILRALIFRRYSEEQGWTGTKVIPPFSNSTLVLRTMLPIMKEVQDVVSKTTENLPRVQVNRIARLGKDPSERASKQAAAQERAIMGMWHAANGEEADQIIAWAQVTMGVGWCLCLEKAAAWGVPERIFYDDMTDEEAARVGAVKVEREGKEVYAENADLYERRKAEDAEDKAIRGESLFVLDWMGADQVWTDYDQRGLKCAVIARDVQATDFGEDSDYLKGTTYEKYGIMRDASGAIVGGISRGEATGDSQMTGTGWFTLYIMLTRDWIGYYVCDQGGTKGGLLVYETEHDYGEVPLYDAWYMKTDSERPEERYTSVMESAYGLTPQINQLLTSFANLTMLKGTPRFAIELKPGEYLVDEATGEPKVFDTEDAALSFRDPSGVNIIQGGGKVISMNDLIRDDGMMLKLLDLFLERLDRVQQPPAATGHGGTSGPAWGVLLSQNAAGQTLRPLATGRAQMWERVWRMQLRTIRRRERNVGLLSVPGSRGTERGMRYYIELDYNAVTDNISASISSRSMQEQVTRRQVGAEQLQAGLITPYMYQEEWAGEDDPDAVLSELDVARLENMGFEALLPQFFQMMLGRMAPALAPVSPNVAQSVSQQLTPPQGQLGIAEAAGVRQPGVGMSPTMPSLPPLQGNPMTPPAQPGVP